MRVVDPPATATFLVENLEHDFDVMLAEAGEEIVQEAKRKAETAATTTSKVNAFGKAALNLAELQKEYGPHAGVSKAEAYVRAAIDIVKVSTTMDEAQKAEFKGQKAKALERYQEALYLVLHDKTDDSEQRELIATLVTRITSLGGEVPPGVPSMEVRLE